MVMRFDGATIWSEDLHRLLPFYRDVIGLPVVMETDGFVILGDFETPRLCIGTHSEVRGRTAEAHRWLVRFACDEIHAEVTRLKSLGAEFIEEPNDQGGDFWLATCKDPDGNFVQLNYWGPDAEFAPRQGRSVC